MMPYEQRDQYVNRLLVGDSTEVLREIPDASIDLVITSPPYYQQRDYGVPEEIGSETSPDKYIARLLQVFHECVRIIHDGGHIVFNIGDKYVKKSLKLIPWRFAIEAMDSEPVKLVNEITWVKLNPTPRQFKRRLVPATEPFFDFVKSDKYYFNLDEFLAEHTFVKKRPKNGSRIGQKYYTLIEQSDLSPKEKATARRKLDEVIQEVKSGKISGFRMKIRGIHAPAFGGQEGGRKTQIEQKGFTIIRILGNRLKRDVIESPVETIKGIKHPAIYPQFVIGELVKLLCPPDGIVLDPFVGSGTTAVVAKSLGRHYVGIDINPEYVAAAQERIETTDGSTEYII
ncbi:MAG: site-specific DNA-methyltransferase [Candidatus Thorarchaeota archaeon]|nr:site-specific DNA-methyltransferase [Candidatus Thorarchaeota archaeon]